MLEKQHTNLSRREREVMDILWRRDRLAASEILAEMADPPSYSAVRALLRTLEQKGHVRHSEEGLRYVYSPVAPRGAAARSAASHLVETFFSGSVSGAVAALIDCADGKLTKSELDELGNLIAKARKEGR
ncbi:MAG: BlaI/MecI/CopY family transcriptional regulator [Bryobacteraceae bacterium]